METNIEGINRYFACAATDSDCPHDYHLLVIRPTQAEWIKANPQYKYRDKKTGATEYLKLSLSDPVSDWAYYHLYESYTGDWGLLEFDVHELPQEDGDRMQVMSDIISGRVTVEELKDAS